MTLTREIKTHRPRNVSQALLWRGRGAAEMFWFKLCSWEVAQLIWDRHGNYLDYFQNEAKKLTFCCYFTFRTRDQSYQTYFKCITMYIEIKVLVSVFPNVQYKKKEKKSPKLLFAWDQSCLHRFEAPFIEIISCCMTNSCADPLINMGTRWAPAVSHLVVAENELRVTQLLFAGTTSWSHCVKKWARGEKHVRRLTETSGTDRCSWRFTHESRVYVAANRRWRSLTSPPSSVAPSNIMKKDAWRRALRAGATSAGIGEGGVAMEVGTLARARGNE